MFFCQLGKEKKPLEVTSPVRASFLGVTLWGNSNRQKKQLLIDASKMSLRQCPISRKGVFHSRLFWRPHCWCSRPSGLCLFAILSVFTEMLIITKYIPGLHYFGISRVYWEHRNHFSRHVTRFIAWMLLFILGTRSPIKGFDCLLAVSGLVPLLVTLVWWVRLAAGEPMVSFSKNDRQLLINNADFLWPMHEVRVFNCGKHIIHPSYTEELLGACLTQNLLAPENSLHLSRW